MITKNKKVYCVFRNTYDNYCGLDYEELEAIFYTQELAQEFIDFELGTYEVREWKVNSEPLPQTLRIKQKVKEGKIKIIKDGFRFTGE